MVIFDNILIVLTSFNIKINKALNWFQNHSFLFQTNVLKNRQIIAICLSGNCMVLNQNKCDKGVTMLKNNFINKRKR